MIYTANTDYVMSQGGHVAIPMQGVGGGMVAVQTVTPGAQEGQPQMVIVPVSGAVGYQPHLVQVATSGALATGYQEMPTQYARDSTSRNKTNRYDLYIWYERLLIKCNKALLALPFG